MGFFSGLKNAGGYLVNFKVNKWVGYDQIKATSSSLLNLGQNVFTPQQANYIETYEEALQRLKITEIEIQQRRTEFTRLMIVYLLLAIAVFAYSVYIVVMYKNIMGFLIGFVLTIYALTHAFRYHFWIFQIKHKKLGCSLRDWFLDKY